MNEHTDDWAKVQAALANPAWDFRTLDGITRDTSLPRERLERVLLRIRSMLPPPSHGWIYRRCCHGGILPGEPAAPGLQPLLGATES